LERVGASTAELFEAARSRIVALEKQVLETQEELVFFSDEHKAAEERASIAERQHRLATFRIGQLLEQLKVQGNRPDRNLPMPTRWGEFAEWCENELAGRVALTPAARRGCKSPAFDDVTLAARCLLWLANDCRDRRIGGGGSLADETVAPGVVNAPCGSDQYDIRWDDRNLTVDWHVKSGGNTRDPSRCLRIYYLWDTIMQQIVVADMPAHRKTGAS
jgi:hypothetical protein